MVGKWWLFEHTPKFRTFVDAGGYTGEWARVFRATYKRIVVFEPFKKHLTSLMEGLSMNVEVIDKAAYSHNGKLVLNTYKDSACTGIYRHKHIDPTGKVEVNCITIDSLGIKDLDFLNIDTEGSEFEILKGAKETLEQNNPQILVEIHEERNYLDLECFLSNLGYRIEKIRFPYYNPNNSRYDEYFWIKARKEKV